MTARSDEPVQEYFSIGDPLDAVVYDAHTPLLATHSLDHILPTILFTSDTGDVYGTLVDGKWIVKRNRHHAVSEISRALKRQ